MKLVIEIPEEYRSNFEDNRCKEKFDSLATNEFGYVLRKAFENGKPLPKGHGRLIDESKIDWLIDPDVRWTTENRIKSTSETVIEADKESAE